MGLPPGVNLGEGIQLQSPAATPPILPSPQGSAAPVNDMAAKIMQALARTASRRTMQNTAVPMNVPQPGDDSGRNIGMNTGNPHAWSGQRFGAAISSAIKTAVSNEKQNQLLKAEGNWNNLQSYMNELYAAQDSGDQNAVAAAQKKVDSILADPKMLKNMAKALNQDWLNPEKTTVYGEALKNVMKQTDQKAQAQTGLKGMIMKLLGQKQTLQKQLAMNSLTDDQKQQMAREIEKKAPASTPGAADNLKDIEAASKAAHDLALAEKDLRATPEKYETKQITDPADPEGKKQILVAVDKTDPTKPYIEIKGSTGKTAEKQGKTYANEGKLELIAGVPTGRVMHGGQFVAPGAKGYTKEDAAAVNKGLDAYGLSEQDKEKLAKIRGSSYATARAAVTPIAVTDNETGESTYVPMIDVARNPGKYVQPGESEKIAARESVHRSLQANFGALNKDLESLPNGLDTETQAALVAALKSDDPGRIETLIVNGVKRNLPDETLRYLTDLKVMQEDILVLRTVGGMGQGSDMMRAAMMRTIPGAGTSSVKEARMQLAGAQRTGESLFAGRPKAGFTKTGEGGTVKLKAPNGQIKEVPADQAQHYLEKGATVVQ